MLLVGMILPMLAQRGVPLLTAVPGWVTTICLVLGGLGVFCQLMVSQKLLVSAREVRVGWWIAGIGLGESAVRADRVEQVVIRDDRGRNGLKTVQAITDHQTVSFGRSLSREQRRWVRDCVATAISGLDETASST
jgi:hypothetical protein